MTPAQAKTATLDDLRAWLAGDEGWHFEYNASDYKWWRWNEHPTLKSRTWCKGHPYPPTLDGAAAALPEVWVWTRHVGDDDDSDMWIARKRCKCGPQPVTVHDHGRGHEIEDLYRLAVLCRLAEKGVAK